MNRIVALTLLAASFLFLAFTKPKAVTYKVDTKNSSVEWVGRKVTGQHNGTINLVGGELILDGNTVKAGTVAIDMNSIIVSDLSGNSNRNLVNHLKSDDFFAVASNPVSRFEITKVTAAGTGQVNVIGNLTIKGITQSLSFPASVRKQGDVVVAVAKGIKVDRTKYDIRYRSKTIFGDLGDKAIDDHFELSLNLIARKNQ